MKLTFNINIAIQALGMAIQGLTMATGVLPAGSGVKETVILTVAVLQAVTALVAHFKNPDGASVSEPYVKQ